MSASSEYSSLRDLPALPYVDGDGQLPSTLEGKIGVYAIYDEDHCLGYIGYSRDVLLSLRQHLVRQPSHCHWVKVLTVERPNRTLLEAIKADWLKEQSDLSDDSAARWEKPIDVREHLLPEERSQYADPALDDLQRQRVLKQAARRLEASILEILSKRGLQEAFRFNPKLKEAGLLDLK